MAITTYSAIGVKIAPDSKGLRFYGQVNATGDASGGEAICVLTFKPWRDVWVVVDRYIFFSTNANTDKVSIAPQTNAFQEPATWAGGTPIDAGVTDAASYNGFMFFGTRQNPIYLGRFTNGYTVHADDMLVGIVSPNTNTKSYAFCVAGRLFYEEPSLRLSQ